MSEFFQIPVSTPFSKALSSVKQGADKLNNHYDVFIAFRDLFRCSATTELTLSENGREGLSFMFELLANDVIEASVSLHMAWETLSKGEEHE